MSNPKLNLFSIISYVNSNYTKIFLVSITEEGHFNFIVEASSIGGDAGYYIEKRSKMINDTSLISASIEKETIFNEKNLPDSLRYDSVVTNYSILFNKKLSETSKHYSKIFKVDKTLL